MGGREVDTIRGGCLPSPRPGIEDESMIETAKYARGIALGLALTLAGLSMPDGAIACPVCDRETGRQVRAGIFDEEFGRNLMAATLPFVVFLGVVAAIHGGRRPPGSA
jgi:hypothetical protein